MFLTNDYPLGTRVIATLPDSKGDPIDYPGTTVAGCPDTGPLVQLDADGLRRMVSHYYLRRAE